MPRRFFYNSSATQPLDQYQLGDTIHLTTDIHHHWCRVLRARVGEKAVLFDGFGGEYAVELVLISKKSSEAKLLSFTKSDNTPNMTCEIGLVMSRGDRMDYAIQKATEMGVTSIQLLSSQYGEVRLKPAQIDKKLYHWQQIAISACEQCGMNRIPLIRAPLTLSSWLDTDGEETFNQATSDGIIKGGIHECIHNLIKDNFYTVLQSQPDISLVLSVPNQGEPPIPKRLSNVLSNEKKSFFRLLIGAEGGLSEVEIQQSIKVGFQPWQIGERVLRTETAPVVALAALQTLKLYTEIERNK